MAITANLDRYIAELVGGYADVTLGRAVLEVLGNPPPPDLIATSYRYVVEVLLDVPFVAPAPETTNYRITAEVLGLAAGFLGKRAELGRAVLEVLVSARVLGKGLYLPAIPLSGVAVVARVTLPLDTGPGYMGLLAENGDGFEWKWPGDGSAYTLTWRQGGIEDVVTLSGAAGPLVTGYTSAGNGTPVALTSLGLVKPEGITVTGEVHELMVLDTLIDSTLMAQYKAYISCHWTPGCTARPTPCTEAPPAGNHHYVYGAVDILGFYIGYLYGPAGGSPTNFGTSTPDDNLTYAAVTVPGSGQSLWALMLDTEEGLTQARVTVLGNEYIIPGAVVPGASLGVASPFIFVGQALFEIPDITPGVTFTVDYE